MTNILKLLTTTFVVLLLNGCVDAGPQASFTDRLKDNFLLTSPSRVSGSEMKCVTLTKPFAFKSGSVRYVLPAGKYKSYRKSSAGYFYIAPGSISKSRYFAESAVGIYLNNEFTHGNLFGTNPDDLSQRPMRGTVLPNTIFPHLKKNKHC